MNIKPAQMNFALVALILCLPATALQQARAQSQPKPYNLLLNGSFETEAWMARIYPQYWDDRPEHWSRRDFVRMVKPDFPAADGQTVLQVDGPTDQVYLFQPLHLLPGRTYRFRVQVRSPGLDARGVQLRVHYGSTVFSAWSGRSDDWQPLEMTFKVPAEHAEGRVDIAFDTREGEQLWIDAATLTQVAGEVPVAKAPTLQVLDQDGQPATDDSVGPVHLRMTAPSQGGTIRYTIDGSEPHRFSTAYPGQPVRLIGSVKVRARHYHGGLQPSAVSSVSVSVRPDPASVPFVPASWGRPVDQWWQSAAYRTMAAGDTAYKKSQEPAKVINVADVRDAHPHSPTAGIQEAIDMLGDQPGTLWFPRDRGPYTLTGPVRKVKNYYDVTGQVLLLRRGDLRLISDGATIRYRGRFLGVTSMQYADERLFTQPVERIHIKGLVFDGQETSSSTIQIRHASRVLIEDCHFTGLVNPSGGHPGAIEMTSMPDNLWVRRCRFDSGAFAFYIDGLHSGGILQCHFGAGLQRGGVLMLTNNDMAPYSAAQRSTQYMVVDGCQFDLPIGANGVQATAANLLVSNNRQSGRMDRFVFLTGRGPSNIVSYLRYNGGGLHLVDNQLHSVRRLVHMLGEARQYTWPDRFMKHLIARNHVKQAQVLLSLQSERGGDGPADIEVRDNTVAQGLEQLLLINEMKPGGPVSNLLIEKNSFSGAGMVGAWVGPGDYANIRVRSNHLAGVADPMWRGPGYDPAAFSASDNRTGETDN